MIFDAVAAGLLFTPDLPGDPTRCLPVIPPTGPTYPDPGLPAPQPRPAAEVLAAVRAEVALLRMTVDALDLRVTELAHLEEV